MAPRGYALAEQRPSEDDDDATDSTPFNGQPEKRPPRLLTWTGTSWMTSPIWFFLAVALILLNIVQAVYILVLHSNIADQLNPYLTGFPNEYDDVKPVIKVQQKRFTSAIRNNPDGSLFMAWADNQPRYTTSGASHEDVDEAWDDLLGGRYLRLKDAEIDWMNHDKLDGSLIPITNLSWVEPGTYGGPDMLHSLHCINTLRKHLDLDYYYGRMSIPEEYRAMHIDHCIDHLRQAVLCHGDMTPVTLRPVTYPDGKVWSLLGETEYTHTCRNGLELREWWWKRGEEMGRLDV